MMLSLWIWWACETTADLPPVDSDTTDETVVETDPTIETPVETETDTDGPPGPIDVDADGYIEDDCDNDDEQTYPGAPELCDGRDNDCDELVPEAEAMVDGAPACKPCSDAGFYDEVRDATDGADLWARLRTATSTNRACDYGDTTDFMFITLDKVNGEVECVYTGERVAVGAQKPPGDVMNTEHTWPQSLGGDVGERRCDLHHLFPTTSDSNGARGSYPLRPVYNSVSWSEGGSRLGEDALGERVFEPRDLHKGNAARSLLYMHLRYGLVVSPEDWALYRGWHAFDPPNEVDHARNLGILDRQGNANPFVACPQTVDLVVVP